MGFVVVILGSLVLAIDLVADELGNARISRGFLENDAHLLVDLRQPTLA